MQQTQTLTSQLPKTEQEAFKQTAVEIKDKYLDQYAFWLALADEFEKLTRVQEMTLPEVGRRLEQEIFVQELLGTVED
ncbi:hypothetical protein [Allocoleopsis sp.]|uniref:hypothetical protein n=1 Tax=Allocoleopsis sp. TaxID=3088169 RepID=UPI002FD4AF39